MKVICCLKTFSFTDSPLAGYGIVYCILGMVIWFREINILYFLDFSNLHIKAGSFSTGFALLKENSKDRIKRNHFLCQLYGIIQHNFTGFAEGIISLNFVYQER